MMPRWSYGLPLLLLIGATATFALGGLWTWLLPAFVFGLVPLVELFWTGNGENPRHDDPRASDPLLEGWLWLSVVLQVGALVAYLVLAPQLSGWAIPGAVLSMGLCCGVFGLNVGHELGHRPGRAHRWGARILMGTSLYAHFLVEHNRGHHARVATDDDPASARRGDWVYGAWLRSIPGGLRSALALEARRLRRRQGLRRWLEDEVVVGLVVELGLLGAVAALSPVAALYWLGAALVGVLLLETVNYVEHYGLRRVPDTDGRPETVGHHHSWTADHPVGRVLLFELTRHADHHAHAERPYGMLRHHDDAPRLPTGYPAMILLALLPPVFLALMDRRLDLESRRLARAA